MHFVQKGQRICFCEKVLAFYGKLKYTDPWSKQTDDESIRVDRVENGFLSFGTEMPARSYISAWGRVGVSLRVVL